MNFEERILNDIERCKPILQYRNVEEAQKLIEELCDCYEAYIPGISIRRRVLRKGDTNFTYYLSDLERVKKKLELFVSGGKQLVCKHSESLIVNNSNTNENTNNNTNSNSNSNTIDINILIQNTISEIEDDESLGEKEVEEIISRIREIEKVANTDEKRAGKWKKLKDSFNWLSTKGVDIACKIIPIILKVLEQ
ncbi:hypothetical protein PBV87_12835 [Niameybacter massiliensis]|uniref:Uncharacterized protein n=1 Tax=Holtiella tumoricola TaxID=3018743 RepID=A0AA42DNM6_9FIRM|nr:hypothetical protein [Holtiella tumoricola]MDA3732374.1 hypothetical protein [Holtiella tumoricola]